MSDTTIKDNPADIRTVVREHYGKAAAEFKPRAASSCCGPAKEDPGSSTETQESNAGKLYPLSELNTLPEEVTGLSMGCGDPITLASLKPGQTVLDLGSGGGIDCFMAAKKVGESGHVIGVDMTAEMLEKARANQARLGFKNVEFRLGEIEHLPVADNTVDVIISNCVVNLSPDKPQVFGEAFRVLRPGGRFAVSDIVTNGPLPQQIRESLNEWAGCTAGALEEKDYLSMLKEAGFTQIEIIRNYFDEETVDEYVKKASAESCCDGTPIQIKNTNENGETVTLDKQALRAMIFSANISAYKI